MHWIDEMFVSMEEDRTAALAKTSKKPAQIDRIEHAKKPTAATLNAWNALVAVISKDVNQFNNHKERAGETPVRISRRYLECEVHVPGMDGHSLILTLDNKDLLVAEPPDFPKQPLPIEVDTDGQRAFWILVKSTEQNAKLSEEQLSEYLLKPVLSSALE